MTGEEYRVYRSSIPFPRQTLSAVAQQTLEHDLPSIINGGWAEIDRGKVLEGQWLYLNRIFSDLSAQPHRPSMIFSPMIVETGQQLLISDLNLSHLDAVKKQEAVELFGHFPNARKTFKIRTAVRMQATFPYISPAVSLPTEWSSRVVDAGYYDNYGIVVAAQMLLDQIVREKIAEKYKGVLILEVRAFPEAIEPKRDGRDLAFDWLGSPLEAVLSARGNSMNFRNRQVIQDVRALYSSSKNTDAKSAETGQESDASSQEASPTVPVYHMVLANCTEAESLNWFVPEKELKQMAKRAEEEWQAKAKPIGTILRGEAEGLKQDVAGEPCIGNE